MNANVKMAFLLEMASGIGCAAKDTARCEFLNDCLPMATWVNDDDMVEGYRCERPSYSDPGGDGMTECINSENRIVYPAKEYNYESTLPNARSITAYPEPYSLIVSSHTTPTT